MKFFRNMYQKSKEQKGFTLVEMIVVLVIIAILAAITIPALLKYIDKAREKQVVINARTAYLAAETAVSEAYAENITEANTNFTFSNKNTSGESGLAKVQKNANELTGIKYYECDVTVSNWKVTGITYKDKSNDSTVTKTAKMSVASGSAWEVE